MRPSLSGKRVLTRLSPAAVAGVRPFILVFFFGMVFLDGFYGSVVVGDSLDGLGGGAGAGFGGDDGEAAEDGFGADFDFVDPSDEPAGGVNLLGI